jgi:hypothetical protein
VLWHTVGIFDGADRRVGYCRWSFKSARGDEFKILDTGHNAVGQVGRAGAGVYRVVGTGAAGELGTLALDGEAAAAGSWAGCRVRVGGGCSTQERGPLFLLAAALVLVSLRVPAPGGAGAADGARAE